MFDDRTPKEYGDLDNESLKEFREQLDKWLEDGKRRCPVCQETGWRKAYYCKLPLTFGEGGQSGRYKVIMLKCDKCNHLAFFSPKIAGLPES
jgi:hypothetical protein